MNVQCKTETNFLSRFFARPLRHSLFSQWSKAELASEEARILAELAAIDAKRRVHVSYPPQDPPQKWVRFEVSMLLSLERLWHCLTAVDVVRDHRGVPITISRWLRIGLRNCRYWQLF